MLKAAAKFFLWLAHGVHYQEFWDEKTQTVYYGVSNKKDF